VTQNVTNYQGLPPLISPNTKPEISPLPQLMKKPPVDGPDMSATSTQTDTDTITHTYSQHVTACNGVVRFLPIIWSVNKAKNKGLNACNAHAPSSIPVHEPQKITSWPVGVVSEHGYVRCWSRYVRVYVNKYTVYEKTMDH
jgi:hypothetical protein